MLLYPLWSLPLYAALERLDKSHLEASLDLGAGQIPHLLVCDCANDSHGNCLRLDYYLHSDLGLVFDSRSSRGSRLRL